MTGLPAQQQGCSLPNLLAPVALAAGGYAGWAVGSGYGVAAGIFGAVGGVVLAVPALGLLLLAVVAPQLLLDRLTRRAPPKP